MSSDYNQAAALNAHFCADCNKNFTSAKYLARHLRTTRAHTATKAFQCDIDGCTKAYTRKDELARHQKKVHPGVSAANNQSDNTTPSASNIPATAAAMATGSSGQSTGGKRKRDDMEAESSDSGDDGRQTAFAAVDSRELAEVKAENSRLKRTLKKKDERIDELKKRNAHLLAMVYKRSARPNLQPQEQEDGSASFRGEGME